MKQRLPNGNTLIIDPDDGRIFEVTEGKKRVWECLCPVKVKVWPENPSARATLTSAHRYSTSELSFLKGKANARP